MVLNAISERCLDLLSSSVLDSLFFSKNLYLFRTFIELRSAAMVLYKDCRCIWELHFSPSLFNVTRVNEVDRCA